MAITTAERSDAATRFLQFGKRRSRSGEIYGGLWYPVVATWASVAVRAVAVPQTPGRRSAA